MQDRIFITMPSVFMSLIALALVANGCTSSSGGGASASLGYTADSASKVMGGVGVGVSGTGTLMGKSAFGGNAVALAPTGLFSKFFPPAYASGEGINTRCNTKGEAMDATGTTRLNNSDAHFVSLTIMCKMAYNSGDPETIQGSYTQIKSIACAIERGGITFDGIAHSATMTIDANCFTANQMSSMGVTPGTSMSVTVKASKPWATNA